MAGGRRRGPVEKSGRGDILKYKIDGAHIILTPVDFEERYSKSSLFAIDRIVEEGKGKGYSLNTEEDIEGYIRGIEG